ncbi:MAG: electron transfer flavoprotein subunit alpha/FixB family protein, partial [Bacteroidetes bacterium]|nr:electron transfer flavoprotein subunit alpha/FixB family protein [Bacteroidota bacterium]
MNIIAFAEQRNGQFKKTAFEVVTAAKTLAGQLNGTVTAVVVGHNVAAIAAQLGAYGAAKVIAVDDARLALYSTTAYAKVIAEVAAAESAAVVLLPASEMGKDVAPRVAVKLNAGLASGCTALKVENGTVTATRPVFAGKGLLDVTVATPVKLFTL